jgi:hypothetical protein
MVRFEACQRLARRSNVLLGLILFLALQLNVQEHSPQEYGEGNRSHDSDNRFNFSEYGKEHNRQPSQEHCAEKCTDRIRP